MTLTTQIGNPNWPTPLMVPNSLAPRTTSSDHRGQAADPSATSPQNLISRGRLEALHFAASGHAPSSPRARGWPDTYLARLEVMALLETLNARILASCSATLALEEWCRRHHLAADPRIVAEVLKGSVEPTSPNNATGFTSHQQKWSSIEGSGFDVLTASSPNPITGMYQAG
jgi:hypothetical protein